MSEMDRNAAMDRRTFLLHAGRWLALAGVVGLAPLIPGCGDEATSTTTAAGAGTTAATGAGSASTGTTAVSAGGSTTGATGPADTGTTGSSADSPGATDTTAGGSASTAGGATPDLAVVKGDTVEKNVRAAIALLGGMERFVKKGGKVVVKPNVLTGRPPEYATTTSPELMTAVIKMCWEAGAGGVTVFDNPTSNARAAFETCGLAKAVSDAGAKLVYLSDRNYDTVNIPQGKVLTSWEFVTDALTADSLINLALPKDHGTSGATMTMKNLMGIMGGRRGSIHNGFAQKIVDVNTLVKPTLAILDAYRVLFRNGPTGGSLDDVRLAKTLVAGTNQVSIDAYGTQFFGKKPTDFEWLVEASNRGMGEIDPGKLKIATAQA
jgi:uncharacterized protein (DUF362 family)